MATFSKILTDLSAGLITLPEALALAEAVNRGGVEPVCQDAGSEIIARLDHSRSERCGFPEFIYGAGKTFEEIAAIIPRLRAKSVNILVTRVTPETGARLQETFPEGKWDERGRTFLWLAPDRTLRGNVAVVAAGTSDLPAALEAQAALTACDCGSELIVDVGVAAIHRLFRELDRLSRADVIIASAGMEGALPSVIAGLVKVPVIAVPTSVGYGASLNGMTALLAMLNSCASGVTVVNIDNGFGAATAAARIINSKFCATC